MKNNKSITCGLMALLMAGFFSCQKQTGTNQEPLYKSTDKPPAVTNVKVINIAGGAQIIYDIPPNPGIMYVQADFMVNEKTKQQVKASYFTDTLVVRGFAKSADYKVTLRTVSRSEVTSDPVEVTVHPDTPPYLSVKQSLQIYGDFGGANIQYQNPGSGDLAVVTLVDTTGKPEYVYTNYSKAVTGNFSIRGFGPGERKYGAYVRDRWGNVSDTVWSKVRSMNEVVLDRSIMNALVLPGDQTACCGSDLNVPLRNGYSAGDWAFYGVPNNEKTDSLPERVTVDMGKPVVLSRIRYYMRKNGGAEFRNGTLKYFKIYGSMSPNPNGALDASWTQIGDVFELVKPSGLPYGQLDAADQAEVNNGTEFIMPLPAVPMRYFRLVILENYSGGNGLEMASLKFMGDYQ
ncbi:DUF4959 domain-containing protein [Niabella drilacis]|uniref:F5/8 type C domain-containing protein n=1 Tax=Niabella drilacis (strain DSM 25811 / CCM 8410 / CCUG 62505 / LMG 26954 / E90) TaxID=1285928 RepID=A0A1G6R3V8_NIADE|nr:DUF4959 domain-containing protein [Niabella drilacis]SDC99339.1 protein of unknown function [Niabella drilacis]